MAKKERYFPLNTIGGRIYTLRNELGYLGDPGRIAFYDFLFSDEPGEKDIHPETKRKNIYNWECSERSIPVPVLKKICEKCNCSSDYLLGIEKETNHDLHFVCNYTGLSEDSIKTLRHYKKSKNNAFNIINWLLSRDTISDKKTKLLNLIHLYLSSSIIENYLDDDNNIQICAKDNIILTDGYGNPITQLPLDIASNTTLISINGLLQELKDKIHKFGLIQGKRKYFESIVIDIINKHKEIDCYREQLKESKDDYELDGLVLLIMHHKKKIQINVHLIETKYKNELHQFDISTYSDEDASILQYYLQL